MMNSFPLIESVFSFFAADYGHGLLNLPAIRETEVAIGDDLSRQLTLIPEREIASALADSHFTFFWHRKEEDDASVIKLRAAKWVLAQRLSHEIPARRIALLATQDKMARPTPYQHPALADIPLSPDYLVPITEFDVHDGLLVRNGFAFSVVPPVESPNAQYWFIQSALNSEWSDRLWVRLDPFLWGPVETFSAMMYKMLVYGRPLDWNRIKNLREEDHGRWFPGKLSLPFEFTDYTWSPRNTEVHFQCEEFPRFESSTTRGSRYFHAIYVPASDTLMHLDGAIRVFTKMEWELRRATHVRIAGKVGVRAKVLRVDHELARDALSDLCPQFFVWNYDVSRYFGASIPADF